MESNYSNRDFEQFVKQNADQYRMFPSEKVWKGVHSALHTRRRWYGFGLAFLLLLTGAAVTLVMKSYPLSKKQASNSLEQNITKSNTLTSDKTAVPTPIEDLLPFEGKAAPHENSEAAVRNELPKGLPTIASTQPLGIDRLDAVSFPQRPASQPTMEIQTTSITHRLNSSLQAPVLVTPQENLMLNKSEAVPVESKRLPAIAANKPDRITAEAYPLLTIESVTASYKAPAKKLSWQLFVTPTISYRKLGENKSFSGSNNSGAYPFASLSDVNKAVTHKPDIGLQIGFSGRYPVTKSLKVLAGLQFNINRYDIKAFAYPGEVAVINLDGGNNNTVSTWTYYRSQSGYKSDWLKNFYLSVSLPIGAEVKLFGDKKKSFGVAATIQPTYIIKDRAYLISTDYKNYAEVPWLIRRMNVSTGFETFVNYTKGKTRWQIGPQVRYQLLSSFQNKYPVKENLFDFGVKVGVTLNQ